MFVHNVVSEPLSDTSITALDVNDTVEALQNYAGLVLVKSQTIGSGVSSVTVTNAFSATFDNYKIVLANPDASVAGYSVELQYGTTTTSYYGSLVYQHYNTTSRGVLNRQNASSLYLPFTNTDKCTFFSFDVYSPFLSEVTGMSGTGFGNISTCYFAGQVFTSTSYTDFKLSIAVGTLTGGVIRVYGYNNG
jgi:hypothetical protein